MKEHEFRITRADMEDAMDKYDEYLESGKHSEIFEDFGTPKQFWVRSTRERTDRAYPSKPIASCIFGKRLGGGWENKKGAATELHNSGFIIIDKNEDNMPLVPPPELEFLIRDADRIRLCALNYYIEPARERNEAQISIRAGTLAKDLFLENRMRNVCQALQGKMFQELANVAPPSQTGPDDSTTTTFTFNLLNDGKQPTMDSNAQDQTQTATNLILYGPPGTGKTYATAWEAVRLCNELAENDPLQNDRKKLMEEYQRLVSQDRIEFVTFHQSFSYEDFVEGLRPTTETEPTIDEQGDAVASGGFSLKAHAGVFKVISERARLDTGNAVTNRLDRSRPIYKIALGKRGSEEDQIRECLDQSLIHISWGGDIDWSDDRFDDYEAIRKEWNTKKNSTASGQNSNIMVTGAFRSQLQIGDYVVISDGIHRFRAFGKVTGEYEFDPTDRLYPHRRRVEWIWRDDNGAERAAFYSKFFHPRAAHWLKSDQVNWDGLEAVVIGPNAYRPDANAGPHVLIIDEINRANISKVFGELITLLETDKRLGCENEVKVRLPYSGTRFGVPSNLHIIGTMNTADRSIALLDTALRRRFTFQELMPNPAKLSENVEGINLRELLAIINERIEYLFDREHQIGHAYFIGCRSRADVEDVMRHKVIPLLAEYFYEDWSKVAAVLGDRAGADKPHFLEARRLSPLTGSHDDEHDGEKLRWSVKAEFDLSEFEA